MSGTLVSLPRKNHSVKFKNPLLYFLRPCQKSINCDVFNVVYDQNGEKRLLRLQIVILYAYVQFHR